MKASSGLVAALLVCALAGMGALGCNTVKGAGTDIEKGGKGIQNAADNTQNANGHPRERPHTITASADLGGSISPSGSTSVPRGSYQTFIATASTGYRVLDVLVDGQSVGAIADLYHDDSSSYTFNKVAANHVISASFAVNGRR